MPKLTVNGEKFEVETGTRLIVAIREHGIRIGQRCGGYGTCTTCRVEFLEGEPDSITEAEVAKLGESSLVGKARLACQIECIQDMHLRVLETVEDHPEWGGYAGPEPEETVTPEAVWYPLTDFID